MEVKLFQDENKEEWDTFVAESESGTLFHTWDWLKIVESHSVKKGFGKAVKSKFYPLGIYENSKLIGIFPLFFYDIPFFRIVASPPFAVENYYMGPVFIFKPDSTPERQQILSFEFFSVVDEYIKTTLRPRFILIHTAPGIHDIRALKWSGYDVDPRYTYRIDLTRGEAALWKTLPSSLKRYIAKAEKAGVVIREGDKDDLLHIYNLLKKRDCIHPEFSFIEEIFNKFYPGNIRIFIAYHGEERLSGIVTVVFKNTVYFWVGCPKYLFQGFSPNEPVMWNTILWAMNNGYSQFEIMGADDESLFSFKRKFNGTLSMYFTARWMSPMIKVIESAHCLVKPRY